MFRYLLYLLHLLPLLLLAATLSGQQDTRRQTQWAVSARYSQPFTSVPSPEPSRNGDRTTINQRGELELEARLNERFSLLGIFHVDRLRTQQENQILSAPEDLEDPFALLHPYTSRTSRAGLQLGAQYNRRLTQHGDLSFALLGGLGLRAYYRAYDAISGRIFNDNVVRSSSFNGIFVDRARNVTEWQATARLQYTHWFSRCFAINFGVQYLATGYLGGGIETNAGTRYASSIQESALMLHTYNRNYDRNTLFPDPTPAFNRSSFFVGVTQRLQPCLSNY